MLSCYQFEKHLIIESRDGVAEVILNAGTAWTIGRPPKPYKLLIFFFISVILFKMAKHSDFHLSFFQIVGAWRDFTVVTKLMNNFKSLNGFEGHSQN